MQAITDFHDGRPFPAGSPELHIFCDAVTGRCKWCEQMSGPPDHARSECHFCPQPRPCAVGQYSDTGRDESGRKACQPCPSGRTNARAGSTKCDVVVDASGCNSGSVWSPEDGKCVNACTHAAVRALMGDMALTANSDSFDEAAFYFNYSSTNGCRYLWGPSYFATRDP